MPATFNLDTLFIGHNKLHFASLPSTNDYLKEIIARGEATEGLIVCAKHQTSGRGQIGNVWEAEKGKNLLMSIFLQPTFLKARHFFYFNMSVCLALVETLNFFEPGFQIKWPNDILFDKKKIAGILIENSITGSHLQHSVIGIGLNVNQRQFGPSLNGKVTSLGKILNKELDIEYILGLFAKKLEIRYMKLRQGTREILNDYFSFLYGYHQKLQAEIDGKKVGIRITDVLPDGQLVATVEGEERRFLFKEIRFI